MMSLSGPKSARPVVQIRRSPLAVRGMSVVPVWRPEMDQDVSPWRMMNTRGTGGGWDGSEGSTGIVKKVDYQRPNVWVLASPQVICLAEPPVIKGLVWGVSIIWVFQPGQCRIRGIQNPPHVGKYFFEFKFGKFNHTQAENSNNTEEAHGSVRKSLLRKMFAQKIERGYKVWSPISMCFCAHSV